jgi:hypothetical protein
MVRRSWGCGAEGAEKTPYINKWRRGGAWHGTQRSVCASAGAHARQPDARGPSRRQRRQPPAGCAGCPPGRRTWPPTLACTHTRVRKHIGIRAHMHMHAHARTCMHMHAHARTCMHMHAHARICMHMHAHACTCMRTQAVPGTRSPSHLQRQAPLQPCRVHKLPEQRGQLLLFAEHRRLCRQPLGAPESGSCPVSQRPRDAELADEGKQVLVFVPKSWDIAWGADG